MDRPIGDPTVSGSLYPREENQRIWVFVSFGIFIIVFFLFVSYLVFVLRDDKKPKTLDQTYQIRAEIVYEDTLARRINLIGGDSCHEVYDQPCIMEIDQGKWGILFVWYGPEYP